MGPKIRLASIASLLVLTAQGTIQAQGLYLPGGGASHLSMGGASTATPVDAIGALYWNPAAIGRLGRSEVAIGGSFLIPQIDVESTAPGPLGQRSGKTRSDSGVGMASDLGVVFQPEESSMIFGLGLATLGGGGVNFPGDLGNPILSGIGPLRNVQGPIFSSVTMVQLTPTAAYKVSDRLVVGLGPTISAAITSFDPAYFGGSDDANGDGIGTFPTASHARPFWGGGFRAGAVYSLNEKIDVGFSYTSKQWFETWTYHARDELGLPRTLTLDANLPTIYSGGVSYRANEKLLVSFDLRYFDYKNTDLFGTPLVSGGLGWKSVFAAAVGGRYQLNDRMAMSAGYVYNENPIRDVGTLFNVQAPAITKQTVSVGATVALTEAMSATLGYAYGLRNSITGPVREATGVGTTLSADVHQITFTTQFKFGGCCRKACESDCGCPTFATPVEGGVEMGRVQPIQVSSGRVEN